MGLGGVPLVRQSIPRQSALFTMPWAGTLTLNGKLYALAYPTTVDNNFYLNIWDDPTFLPMYRTIDFAAAGAKVFGLTYDPTNQKLYIGPWYHLSPRAARIWQWDLRTEQWSIVVNDVALGVGSPQNGTQSSLTNDGTHIYAIQYTQNGVNSYVHKFRISDGVLVAQIQMVNPPVGTGYSGCQIYVLPSGNIVCGSIINGWVALLPNDLSTVTTIIQPDSGNALFGMQIINGNVWVGSDGHPAIYKITPDLLTVTTYDLSKYVTAAIGGGVTDMRYDGVEYLWLAMNDYTVLGIDVATGDVDYVLPELTSLAPSPRDHGNWQLSMIWPIPQGIALADQNVTATQNTFGYFIEYGDAKNQPRLLGRGTSGRR